jgi:LPXTG-motif cell wall-anchored protein
MKPKSSIFKSGVSALSLSLIAFIFFLIRGEKPKDAFQQIRGIVIELTNIHESYPRKDTSKYRYLLVDSYEKPFQLFVGKSRWDFKPKLERIDDLEPGDTVTVFFEETFKTENAPVNNLVYYIDRGQEAIFIEGNSKKNLLYGLIGFCILMIIVLILLKRKNKII